MDIDCFFATFACIRVTFFISLCYFFVFKDIKTKKINFLKKAFLLNLRLKPAKCKKFISHPYPNFYKHNSTHLIYNYIFFKHFFSIMRNVPKQIIF